MSATLGLTIIGGVVLCFICGVIFLVKNEIVSNHRIKAINIVSNYARKAISKHKNWREFYDLYHSYPSYNKMLFDLTKWKYEDFYGDLENKCKELLEKED